MLINNFYFCIKIPCFLLPYFFKQIPHSIVSHLWKSISNFYVTEGIVIFLILDIVTVFSNVHSIFHRHWATHSLLNIDNCLPILAHWLSKHWVSMIQYRRTWHYDILGWLGKISWSLWVYILIIYFWCMHFYDSILNKWSP